MVPEIKYANYIRDQGILTGQGHAGFIPWQLNGTDDTPAPYFPNIAPSSANGGFVGSEFVLLYADIRFIIRPRPVDELTWGWRDSNWGQIRIIIIAEKNNTQGFPPTGGPITRWSEPVDRKLYTPIYDKVIDMSGTYQFDPFTGFGSRHTQLKRFRFKLPLRQKVGFFPLQPSYNFKQDYAIYIYTYAMFVGGNSQYQVSDRYVRYYYTDP